MKAFPRVLLRHVARSSYAAARAIGLWRLRAEWRRKQGRPFLVYQMGKVGSSAITNALRHRFHDRPVYHIHTLDAGVLSAEEEIYRQHFRHRRSIGGYVLQGLFLRTILRDLSTPQRRPQVVSLVRDPVARNVSTFFQNLQLHHSDAGIVPALTGETSRDQNAIAAAIDHFVASFPHDAPLTWFEREIRPVMGIDVLDGLFPTEAGYRIWHRDGWDLLVLRLDDLDERGGEAFEAIGIKGLEIGHSNVASTKPYADFYRRFRADLRLPDFLLDQIYESRFGRTFYSDSQRHAFRLRWSTGVRAIMGTSGAPT